MAHTVLFESFDGNWDGLLSRQDVIDMIDLFFDGPDTTFTIVGVDHTPGRRGSCAAWGGQFKITLSRPTIELHMEQGHRMGGNKPHTNLKVATLSVLAHEIQHANQDRRYRGQTGFWTGKYIGRPCERDARRFADENEDIIAQMIDLYFFQPTKQKPDVDHNQIVQETAEVFSFIDGEIEMTDIIEELRLNGANNPVNVNKVISILKNEGKVVRRI